MKVSFWILILLTLASIAAYFGYFHLMQEPSSDAPYEIVIPDLDEG